MFAFLNRPQRWRALFGNPESGSPIYSDLKQNDSEGELEGWRGSLELRRYYSVESVDEGRLPGAWSDSGCDLPTRHRWVLGPILLSAICGLAFVIAVVGQYNLEEEIEARPRLNLNQTEKLGRLYGVGEWEGRSWLSHVEGLDDRDLAPSTKFTQQFIHDWQNPPLSECSSRTFYTPKIMGNDGRRSGLGSTIHILTLALRTAIEKNAILAWDEDNMGRDFVDEACRVDGVRSLDCIFERVTSCPRSTYIKTFTSDLSIAYMDPERTGVPTVVQKALEKSLSYQITGAASKYWWRGQASAYLMRLSPASLTEIRNSRFNATEHYSQQANLDGSLNSAPMPWPLPPGSQSMHIRHGDKASEMKLIPFIDYVAAGELLADSNPNSYHKAAFISSEDASVFEEAKSIGSLSSHGTATPNERWTWYGSHINRMNTGPFAQLDAFGNRTLTTLSWMAEFMIAMECDAFIGTRGSNWNRLIDELRCVWIDSCRGPFVEVGTDESWWDYNWK